VVACAQIPSKCQKIEYPASKGGKKVRAKISVSQEADATSRHRNPEEYVRQMESSGVGQFAAGEAPVIYSS